MYNRLYNFLAEHNIISKKQYGFSENYSTYMSCLGDYVSVTVWYDETVVVVGLA